LQHFSKIAADVFARKGYHETTVDEIALAMGVAKGTVYYNYKNKEDLYMSVIQEGVDLLKQQLQQAVDQGATTREKIANIIDSQLNFYEYEKGRISLFLTELFSRDPQRTLPTSQMLSDCLQIIRSCIESGIADGTFARIDPETATSSLFGMITISAVHYVRNNLPIPRRQIGPDIERIFMRGITASTAD
jgi:AcrR family transcriptional regulator